MPKFKLNTDGVLTILIFTPKGSCFVGLEWGLALYLE